MWSLRVQFALVFCTPNSVLGLVLAFSVVFGRVPGVEKNLFPHLMSTKALILNVFSKGNKWTKLIDSVFGYLSDFVSCHHNKQFTASSFPALIKIVYLQQHPS